MSLALAAGMVSSVLFAASNVPMLVKARRTRDLSSYSLPYLVLNNAGNLLYCLYVYDLPPGPIWAMQFFYLLSMGLLLRWYLRFTPRRARIRYSGADPQPAGPGGVLVAAHRRTGHGHPPNEFPVLRPRPSPANRAGLTRCVEFAVLASTPT